ncbi:MAG: GTPase Era [Rickettsiaceae bacterium]|nr:GTPase Era [Rickettsiaceae bacterium]
MTKSSTIAIIGKPNAGKSTLLNALLGQKISIVSPKVQTTRATIKGIVTKDEAQLVFIDTPGIFSPKRTLEKSMVRAAWSTISGATTIAIIIDASNPKSFDGEFHKILEHIATIKTEKIILLNKLDKFTDTSYDQILSVNDALNLLRQQGVIFTEENSELLKGLFREAKCFLISALKQRNIDQLVDYLIKISPEGPFAYPEDDATDASMRFLCAEITREKLFLNLSDELPYNLTVETEKWEQISKNQVKIYQNIIVPKESHKMIILGNKGETIKNIGISSRKEIKSCFGVNAHLFLFVKVRLGWDEKNIHYQNMGLTLVK